MRLWEYLLAEDQRIDLSTPGAAAAWLRCQPWGLRADAANAPPDWARTCSPCAAWPGGSRAGACAAGPPPGRRTTRRPTGSPSITWG